MSDVLDRILADKRLHVASRKRALGWSELARATAAIPAPRGFAQRLVAVDATGHPAIISEIKRASPSRGLIRPDFDPAELARAYRAGGAACLSVLTDTPYFQGTDDHLRQARAACDLPILRKDFMIDPYQAAEARALGADCILLILAALDDGLARELIAAAVEFGLDVLAEVHDAAELDRALALDTKLVGINNRNLKTLAVDLATTEALAPRVPADRVTVSESGLHAPADLIRMRRSGARAFLIGESLMREKDVAGALRRLTGVEFAAENAAQHKRLGTAS